MVEELKCDITREVRINSKKCKIDPNILSPRKRNMRNSVPINLPPIMAKTDTSTLPMHQISISSRRNLKEFNMMNNKGNLKATTSRRMDTLTSEKQTNSFFMSILLYINRTNNEISFYSGSTKKPQSNQKG